MRNLAKKAMTTDSQKICYVVDHLIEALGNEPGSSLRRAMILNDIDQYPGTTQTGVMERLGINKSALNREIEWLFNYGCIMRQECEEDARAIRLKTCGYSKKALDAAFDYFDDSHNDLRLFLEKFSKLITVEKPSLRDAKILATLYDREEEDKHKVLDTVPGGSASSNNRAYNKLVDEGIIEDG